MPYKHHEPRRHRIPGMRFEVTNWPDYDEGLRRRGSLTSWIEQDVLDALYAAPRTTPGGQPIYDDGAIELILTLGMVYHLPLRQTEGVVRSLMALLDLRLRVPHHSTLSRRRKRLDIEPTDPSPNRAPDIVIDATGLKTYGAGEGIVALTGLAGRFRR